MRDLVFLTLDGIFKEITGESAGDAYTKALISNREIWEGPYGRSPSHVPHCPLPWSATLAAWIHNRATLCCAATKFIAYRARITAILNRRCDEDLWACMGLGATTAYLGACTLCIPIMFAGTFVTDHCKPHGRVGGVEKGHIG